MLFLLFLFTWFDWQVIKTENWTLIYKPGYEWEALQTLQNLEYYRAYVIDLTGNNTRNLPVVIEDIGTVSNGFANPLFYNIHIFTYPPGFGSFLEGVEDWYRLVSVHEYTHIAHMTKTSGIPKFLTRLFGAAFQPNMYSPGWIIEGITVYSESQVSPYEGRLNDGFFDSYIGARVYEKQMPTIIEATNEPLSFPYGKIYLYGGEFFNFLSGRYGPDKFSRFFSIYGSYPWAPLSLVFPGIGLDIAAKRVYCKPFSKLFSEWHEYEKGRFANWCPEGTRITHKAWYITSLVADEDKLYFVREIPIKLDAFRYKNLIQIIGLDLRSQREEVITTLNSSTTTRIKIYQNSLYYTTAEIRRAENVSFSGFGITSVLHKMNLQNRKDEILLTDDIRAFCILNDSTLLYVKNRLHQFGSEIWLYANGHKKRVWEGPYLIYDIETDGKRIVVSASGRFENPNLYTFDPDAEEFNLVLATPWTEGNLSLKAEDQLMFTANFDGQHSIYAIKISEPSSIWRYTHNGFVSSFVARSNGLVNPETLYFVGLNGKGFDIYKKMASPESYKLTVWEPSPKPDFSSNRLKLSRGNYFDVLKTLFPSARIPLILPADKSLKKWLYSAMVLGGDATNEHIYTTFFAYDQLKKSLVCQALLLSTFFSPAQLSLFYSYNDYLRIATDYPLLNRLSPGFSRLSILLNGKSYDGYKRKELAPGFRLAYRLPYRAFAVSTFLPLERKTWGSSIVRTAYIGNMDLSQLIFNGELRINISGYIDSQNPDKPAISIRGYRPIQTPRGAIFTTEYSHHLLNLRWGLWNPNIYFEDLFGALFFDLGIIDTGDSFYSVGFEIKLETKIGFGFLRLVPKFGIAWTKEKELKPFFKLIP